MSEIVKLVSAWDAFEKQHPGSTVEEFCSYHLLNTNTQSEKGKLFSGIIPPNTETQLAKLIGRIAMMHQTYIKLAIKDIPDIEPEWFFIMNAVYHKAAAPKSDIICYNFLEHSTGMDILRRLKEAGYTEEKPSPEDRRAKLVSLTQSGRDLLFRLYALMYRTTYIVFKDIDQNDQKLIIKLLQNTEIKHSNILDENRNKSFDEIFEGEVSDEEAQALAKDFADVVSRFCAQEKLDKEKAMQSAASGQA